MIFELTPPLLNKQKRTLSREHGFLVQFIVCWWTMTPKDSFIPFPLYLWDCMSVLCPVLPCLPLLRTLQSSNRIVLWTVCVVVFSVLHNNSTVSIAMMMFCPSNPTIYSSSTQRAACAAALVAHSRPFHSH